MKVKWISMITLMFVFLFQFPVYAAQTGYFEKLGSVFTRGVKNVISAPYEIPYTMGQYDAKQDGNTRAFRNLAGFFDGMVRTVTRAGTGAWDMMFSFIPGQQDETSLSPMTFF